MKPLAILLTVLLAFITEVHALIVKDPSHIAISLSIAKKDLLEQARRANNQQTQILRLVEQIRQIDTFLKRLGDPEKVKDLEGMKEMDEFLSELDLSKTSEEIIRGFEAEEIHSDNPHSSIEAVARTIEIDGEEVADVQSHAFKSEVTMRRTVSHYREVRSEVLKRREVIKAQLQRTLEKVETASTQSEMHKLEVIINSLQSQLDANDREMQFAANEVLTRYLENEVEKSTRAKLRVQQERAILRVGAEKDLEFYRLPSEPLLFQRK
ncbi:hypothetical protein AAFN60_19230 [Roseibacillus persicicus]|uniref:hypothetical protein n=1 Tax=Roseibacillus persicicus TaxID=454148 RepID=UPI00398B9204